MELVRAGAESLDGSVFTDMEEPTVEVGAEPVCMCVGGFWRYGMKERTLCSASAGEMLAHYSCS